MNFLKRVFAFYINSSIHVALAVVALLAVTVLEYKLTVLNAFWWFVFLAALTGYNFVKYAKVAGLHHRSLTHSLKLIQVFSAVCFAFLVYFAFQLRIAVLLLTIGFGMATFLYAVPVIRSKNLRNFSGIKVFVVAFVWAGVSVILPFIASKVAISPDVFLTFFQRILIVVALILPFEIRDVPYDGLNLKTLPQQLGVKNTKLLGQIILLLCLVFEFFKVYSEVPYLISLLIFCVVLGWLLVISKTQQTRYFASFLVEGLPIMWLLLYLLFEQF
jgi:hypothetical protein